MGVRQTFRSGPGRPLAGLLLAASLAIASGCGTPSSATEGRSSHDTPTSAHPTTPDTTRSALPAATPSGGGGRLGAPNEPGTQRVQLRHASLTTENWATYDFRAGTATVTASAPDDLVDSNVREVFWRADAVPAPDEQACITWDETAASIDGEPIQPGLAMRIASVGTRNEGIKAVTLTENVVFAGTWLFNVHVWDTTRPVPMTLVKTFDVSAVVGRIARIGGKAADSMVDPPWHLCGRTLGDTFSFKIWTGDEPEPTWSDPDRVFATFLPPGWDHSGYSGGYIGHLHPGQSATATAELARPIAP